METAPAARGTRRASAPPRRKRRERIAADSGFERFYRDHVKDVYQYALGVLANPADAEDVTQQTFLNAYRAFQRGERPHTPHNWLIKIAHNVCRMRWRQSGRRPYEVPLESAPEPAGPDGEKPALDEVLQALAQLPLNQRAAIVMREVEGRSYAEIAEVLDTSVPAVEALLFRARANLRAKRDALGVLTLVPVPGSLSSFIGASGAGLAAGGAAIGTEIALKAVAVVATGVVAGGLGFKAVKAVAKPAQPPTQQSQLARAAGAQQGASPVQRIAGTPSAKASRRAALSNPGDASGHGSTAVNPRKAPMGDRPSDANAPLGAGSPTAGAPGATPGTPGAAAAGGAAPSAGRAGGSSAPMTEVDPGTTVNKIVRAVPLPAPLPPPPTLPAVPITVPTVTVPTVTLPTATVPTVTVPTVTVPTVTAPAVPSSAGSPAAGGAALPSAGPVALLGSAAAATPVVDGARTTVAKVVEAVPLPSPATLVLPVSVPTVTTPILAAPSVTTPTVTVPTIVVPSVTTSTAATPSVTTPPVTVPPVTVPTATVPPVTVPTATVPPVTPIVTTPTVTTPTLTTPTVTTPAVTVPTATVPTTTATVMAPNVTTPTATTPTVTPPTVTTPTVTTGTVTTPTATTPTVTTPTVTTPTVTTPTLPAPPPPPLLK